MIRLKRMAQVALTGPSAPITLYTVPGGGVTTIQTMDICETEGSQRRISFYVVPSGQAAGTSNALFYNLLVAAYGVLSYTGPLNLESGDKLMVSVDGNGLTITISGMEQV